MDKAPAPPLLPILRSTQQAVILALLLGDPDLELSLTDVSSKTGTPYASVHREIERAEAAGLVSSRRVGNTRLVKANSDSPYYPGLADVLTKAFGIPQVVTAALRNVDGVTRAFVFGSWAARFQGETGTRPVGDIDVLVLGDPDRNALYEIAYKLEQQLGRPVQVTIRGANWLEAGSGSFHGTITSRPLVELDLHQTGELT